MFFLDPKFIKFVLLGGSAAGINFLSRILLGHYMNYITSVIIAYLIGFIVAYFLFRRYVFNPQPQRRHKEVFYFTLVNIAGIIQTTVVSLLCVKYVFAGLQEVFLREELAHFIGICVPTLSSYFGHKYLSFKEVHHAA